MDSRTALDELQPLLHKLEAFASLRGILEVAATADANVTDAKARLDAVTKQIDAAHKALDLEKEAVTKVRADFEAECDARVAAANAEITKARDEWHITVGELEKRKINLELETKETAAALAKSQEAAENEIASLNAAVTSKKAELAALNAAMEQFTAGFVQAKAAVTAPGAAHVDG